MHIPDKGASREDVFKKLQTFRSEDLEWRSGRMFGYIYDPGSEVREIGERAYTMYLTENALDFTVFPSLRLMENEIVAMAASHLRGGEDVTGNFTSGGSESIMLALKAARDYCRIRRPEIHTPEIILPTPAHAAFLKSAHYLQLKAVQVSVNSETFRADVPAIARAINPNTILLVGSAPSYTHGVIDPIAELGELASKHHLLLHVDACIGGFLLPYFRRLGEQVPDFDFTVPGVTSMSMDLHKYAYTPKGASIVLYRGKELRKYQLFASSRWTGYPLINNTVQSSKSGGPVAAAWAVLNYMGNERYLELARMKLSATRSILQGIRKIKDLRVMGEPEMCLIAVASDSLNIFHVIDEMGLRGWYVQPVYAFDNSKEHMHITVNASNTGWVEPFLTDLAESVKNAKELKPPDPSEVSLSGTVLPKRMAPINTALNLMNPESRERVLIDFVDKLFCHKNAG